MPTAFPYRTTVEWSAEDEAFLARVPALGVVTHGTTEAKALAESRVACELMLETLAEQKKTPPPSDLTADFSGKVLLRLPRSMHARIVERAAADDVSLNQELVSLIALGMGLGVYRKREPRKQSAREKVPRRKVS